MESNPAPAAPPSLPRLWPAYVILVLQAVTIAVSLTPSLHDGLRFGFMMLGPATCVLSFLVWLLGFSKLAWKERFGILLAAIVVAGLTGFLMDPTMGVSLWIHGAPLALAAITLGLRLQQRARPVDRFRWIAALLVLAFCPFTIARLEGFQGNYLPEFAWRWSEVHGSQSPGNGGATVPPKPESLAWKPTALEWPGFRGPTADGRIANGGADVSFTSTPKELWRLPIGPAWSSFAHISDRLFTQEQCGEEEAVTCLDAATGAIIWRTAYPCRFSDVVSGAGPRATPTFVDGRLYTYGGKANLLCLDAATGAIRWQRDLMAEVHAPLPVWGFSSSPIAVGNLVVIYAGGDADNGLIAYDQLTGTPVWRFDSHGMNFSSVQRATLQGHDQLLFGEGSGIVALEPATGALLWRYRPVDWKGPALCQPQQIAPGSIVAPLGDGIGLVRLDVTLEGTAWTVKERWVNKKFKPSFNDFVYHEGHCYGFDNNAFACLDAETGALKWKHRGYGFGQVILLADKATLFLLTEKGDGVFLAADPAQHRELSRFPLIKGKTWNHPIAAAGRLFVRNGEEAVALALSSALTKAN